jgi:putative transposase
MTAPEILAVSPEAWELARRRLPIVRRLAENIDRTRSDVDAGAAELGCSTTHLYKLLRRYMADPRLTSLLPARRGPKHGHSRFRHEVDTLIAETIDQYYLTRQKPTISDLTKEVRRRCQASGLPLPGRHAITARVYAHSAREVTTRRQGKKAARDVYMPVVGSLEAQWPLSLIQIDHTLVDVIVVDSETRAPIQRPWLTLAIDVCTRCVAGFHLSLEPPSATSVALCLSHAVLSKDAWLAERGIEASWPVSGLPERLHLDNAKEFRSDALKRGCEQYGIAIDHRPVRTPHYGGHIERLIGTMMGKVHLLPGTTFSNVQAKGDLDPEKSAAMTLEEVERWLGHAIAGVYHRELHRGIASTPLAAWERGIVGDDKTLGRGTPAMVSDPRRFFIDFLPIERRMIRRDGVLLHSIAYWSDVLGTWIGSREQVMIRYDPRDLSRIYLLGPDGVYYDLNYRDLQRPPISLWEHRLALKRLREDGRALVDEEAIFRTIETMRGIADEAVRTSKAARRQRERRLRVISGGRSAQPNQDQTPLPPRREVVDGRQPYERMLPVEEWS